MAVTKTTNGYAINFSDAVAEKLECLWDNNRDGFDILVDYIYEHFDWVAGIHTDAPALFNDFATKKEAELCDVALSKAIHQWYRENSSFLTEIREAQMVRIGNLVADWLNYVEEVGNEDAGTDTILEKIKQQIRKI